jgi:chitinase
MFWEYFNDSTGILLQAVHAGLTPAATARTGGN